MKLIDLLMQSGGINESSLSRIWQHVEKPNSVFGVISAFRKETPGENEEKHVQLKKDVRDLGLGFVEMKGRFTEDGEVTDEKSLFVPNISKNDAIDLGQKYEQYSILYKSGAEFTEIGSNQSSGLGKVLSNFATGAGRDNFDFDPETLKKFFSALYKGKHRGRPYLFKYLEEREQPSFNRMAYSGRNKPLQWRKIL